MNLQLIRISPISDDVSPSTPRPPNKDRYFYSSIVIEDEGRYYYWAKGVSIEISKCEYELIKENSKLYYFSTAFRLHSKISKLILK